MSAGDMPVRAMALAAGRGIRMRPLTDQLPKPLLPVAGIPLIDRALDWLAASGVNEVVVNAFYKAELLKAHLTARTSPRIYVSNEETVLETGGGVKNALHILGNSPFFVTNTDVICLDGWTPALHRLWQAWDDKAMDALLLLHPVEKAVGYEGEGDFFIKAGGVLRRRRAEAAAPFVFTGVQVLHPRLFDRAPEGAFSLNLLYNKGMRDDGILPRTHALIHDGNWLHVSDPAGLKRVEEWLADDARIYSL